MILFSRSRPVQERDLPLRRQLRGRFVRVRAARRLPRQLRAPLRLRRKDGEEALNHRWRDGPLCNPPSFLQYLNYCHLELDNCALQQYANFRPLKVVESRVCNDNAASQCDDGNCAGCPRYD